MSVSSFLYKQLVDLLEDHRIVVWYDAEKAFGDFVATFKAPNIKVVSGTSTLRARREAEAVYRKINDSEIPAEAKSNLLVYLARGRATRPEDRAKDPFELFALAGIGFGDKEAEQLASLARRAMPNHAPDIEQLFAEGKPTLALLDSLEVGQHWPVLRATFNTESGVEIVARVLARDTDSQRLADTAGAVEELLRLLKSNYGYVPPARLKAWNSIRENLGMYLLFSEFAFDLPVPLPDGLSAVARADDGYKTRILDTCQRMRTDSGMRDGYIALARKVEKELRLEQETQALINLGERDTFPFEERQYLRQLGQKAQADDLASARRIIEARKQSVWRYAPERALLWTVAERAVNLLEKVQDLAARRVEGLSVKAMAQAYVAADGFALLDHRQRLMEQGAAECAEDPEIQPLLELCRERYRDLAGEVQAQFLESIRREGWPPEGFMRQTQVFDIHVAPALEEREKVVFFLADSLRFEMGRDLGEALHELGAVDVQPVASVLPTITETGMAALLPGADGALKLVEQGEELVPCLGTRLVRNVNERMAVLRERYGDRFKDITLGELLSTSVNRLQKKIGAVDLLVVRSQDIDALGETVSLHTAKKYMSELLADLKKAAQRLGDIGFQRLFICADHGHVLLPDIPPGDVVPKPDGKWLKAKRRCLLGKTLASRPGCVILKAAQIGLLGDAEELCVPEGFKVFEAGDGYLHGGLSLQAAIVPLVSVRVRKATPVHGMHEVLVEYGKDRFSTRVIGLRMKLDTLLGEPLRVAVEAYDGTTAKAKKVGEVADCQARDSATKEVSLEPSVETPVPVQLDQDFSGDIEIRVIDPRTGQVLKRLKLKSALME